MWSFLPFLIGSILLLMHRVIHVGKVGGKQYALGNTNLSISTV